MAESHVSTDSLNTTYVPMESTVDYNENTISNVKDTRDVIITHTNDVAATADVNVATTQNVNVAISPSTVSATAIANTAESHIVSGTSKSSNGHQENLIPESQLTVTAIDDRRHNIVPNNSEQVGELVNKSENHVKSSVTSQISDAPVKSFSKSTIVPPPNDAVAVTDVMTSPVSEPTSEVTSPTSSAAMSPSPSPAPAEKVRKKRNRRGSAWSDDQTEFLFEIWARQTDLTKPQDDPNNQSAPVYRIISKAMQETGNPKSWEQCKTRIHTLKRAYKITLDEINAGAANITYCRHFEKLEIIMGDNKSTTPQMLADMLAERRKQRQEFSKSEPTPPKRKLGPCKLSTIRPTLEETLKASPVLPETQPAPKPQPKKFQSKLQEALSAPQPAVAATVMAPPPTPMAAAQNTQWYNQQQYAPQPSHVQQEQQQQQQQHEVQSNPGYQYIGGQRSATMPPPPPYTAAPITSTNVHPPMAPAQQISNTHNNVVIKREQDVKPYQQQLEPQPNISIMTSQPWTTLPKPSQKEELEKMRLNLEMRKIDMERNKLEMEERQRREERDHQYRMLQLLMIGLGQQSSAQPGQGAEQVVHAQNSTNLSRALENGLVPGGPHSANEKGLSFNEI